MKNDTSLGLDTARIRLERAALVISSDAFARTAAGQSAILTLARCAVRSFRGGVFLRGEFDEPVVVGNWPPLPLRQMLIDFGCREGDPPEHAYAIHVGDMPNAGARLCCWTDGWIACVGPSAPQKTGAPGNELSGALAGALGVTEAFRVVVLNHVLAGRRTQRVSPLTPSRPTSLGIELPLLPSGLWLLGLGNLGQAALWVLGLLPYADAKTVRLVLQDMDTSGIENRDTQILTEHDWIGIKKARSCARWAEARGFDTTIIETPFGASTVRDMMPGLALVGVDNLDTRRWAARPEANFDLVLDAGLGATASEMFDIRVHGFPGFRSPDEAWPRMPPEPQSEELAPYLEKMVVQGRVDRCGAFQIAGQAVGVPSTAVAAATIQIAQACRAVLSREICDYVDISLANPARTDDHDASVKNNRFLLFAEARSKPRA